MKRVLSVLLIVIVLAALWWFGYASPEDTGPAPAAENVPTEGQFPPLLDDPESRSAPVSPEPGPPPDPTDEETPWTPDPDGQPIGGWVLTENGEPIPGAKVSIYRRTADGYIRPPDLVAKADGSFRREGLSEGLWIVSASAALRTSGWMGEVEAGRTDLVLTLLPAAELRVRVRGSDGREPPGKVTVQYTLDRWIEADDEYRRQTEFVELTPEFTVKHLPAGRYRIEVRVVGVGLGSVPDIGLKAGEITAVDVSVASGAVIEGTVLTEEKGEPVPGALVVVGRKGDGIPPMYVMDENMALWNNRIPTRTDAEGAFRVPGLEPGPYDVAVRAAGRRPALSEDVAAPTGDGPLVIRLSAGGALAIRVLNREGKPMPGAEVSAIIGEGGEFEASTDEAGRALIQGLPPGETEVGAWTDRWSAKARVRIEVGKTVHVTLRPPPGDAILTGRITRNARPVSDRSIWAQFEAGTSGTVTLKAQTGPDGIYLMEGLLPGKVTLEILDPQGFARPLGEQDVQPGRNTFDLELPVGAILLRVVEGATGKNAAYARVYRNGHWLETADENGLARLIELPDGPQDLYVSRPPDLAPRRVTVLPSQEPAETVVTLSPAARLEIRFLNSEKRPVTLDGIELELLDESGGRPGGPAVVEDEDGIAEGRVRFALAPGTYRLVAEREGGGKASREIQLFASGAEVEIVLR